MKYFNLADVLDESNGASVFARMASRGSNRIVINGRTYGITDSYYNTQCGGQVYEVYRTTGEDMSNEDYWATQEDIDLVRAGRYDPFGIFVHSTSGITQILIPNAHPHDAAWFHRWYLSMQTDFDKRAYQLVTSCEVIGTGYRTSDDTIPVSFSFHAADENLHENGTCEEDEYADNDRECPFCSYEYVNNEGYCTECDEYVLDEVYYNEDYMAPAAELDDVDLSTKEYDYVENDGPWGHDWYMRNAEDGKLYLYGDMAETKGLVCNLELRSSQYNKQEIECTKDTAFDAFFKFCRSLLIKGPVFLSSNMGDTYGHTAWYIEQLQVRADEIREKYGVDVQSPSHYGTNPNMNYHYIDSVNVSVINPSKFEEVVCPIVE